MPCSSSSCASKLAIIRLAACSVLATACASESMCWTRPVPPPHWLALLLTRSIGFHRIGMLHWSCTSRGAVPCSCRAEARRLGGCVKEGVRPGRAGVLCCRDSWIRTFAASYRGRSVEESRFTVIARVFLSLMRTQPCMK